VAKIKKGIGVIKHLAGFVKITEQHSAAVIDPAAQTDYR